MHRRSFRALTLALVVFAGCKDEKPSGVTPAADHASAAAVVEPPKSSASAVATADTAQATAVAPPNPPASVASSSAAPGSSAAQKPSEAIAMPKAKDGIVGVAGADKVLKSGSTPIVKLIDAGADPKAPLVYALDKGGKSSLDMALDMSVSMKAGDKTLPGPKVPRMTLSLDMATADKNDASDSKIDALLTKAGIDASGLGDEQVAGAMKDQIGKLKGLSISYWVSPKGHVRDVKINVPDGSPEAAQAMLQGMNQSFESMVAPLPNEAVGLGAKWQVVTRVASNGADILQFATYTLKSQKETTVTLDVKSTQLAANDAVTAPGMPAGMQAHIKKFSSGGNGSSVVDLKSVAPKDGSMHLKTTMSLAVSSAGASAEESTVATDMTVTFSRPGK